MSEEKQKLGKTQRQHLIARIIETNVVTSQDRLMEILKKELGDSPTQATLSRDLEEMGAIKIRRGGGESSYALPETPKAPRVPEDHLRRVVSDWVVEVEYSLNMVVVHTPPGSAHVVASALDRARLDDILGTVAGDDTIFIVARAETGAEKVAMKLTEMAGLPTK